MAQVDPYGIVGQVLDGQFHVTSAIGEGGFSVVYRGQHVGLEEPVAIKCLKLQAQLGSAVVEAFVRRFRDESKIHYRLSQGSLHIVRTIAAGTTMAPATGALVPYMVLEWLDGFTLSEELRARRHRGERGRSLAEVVRFLDPVAEAMAYAHAQGVVHRDLNPSNIFVAHVGGLARLKVLDFGVAKVISDHAMSLGPRAATIGQIKMFTPAYGAPEQFDDSIGPITPATDVYAFAVMVAELLSDRPPLEASHIGEYADRALDPDRRPTARAMGAIVGDAVEAVLDRAVSIDPSLRPSDVGEFWGMLKNAAGRDAENARAQFPPGGMPGQQKPSPTSMAPGAATGEAGRYKYYSKPPLPPRPSSGPPPPPGQSPSPSVQTQAYQSPRHGEGGQPITAVIPNAALEGRASSISGITTAVVPPLEVPRRSASGAPPQGAFADTVPITAVTSPFGGVSPRGSGFGPAASPAGGQGPAPGPAAPEASRTPPPIEVAFPAGHQSGRPGAPAKYEPVDRSLSNPPRPKNTIPLVVVFAVAITVLLVGVALVVTEFTR